jgi:RNA recognition motif-containing protein
MDRETGKSRGFGFVEMSDDAAAKKAIAELDGGDVDGRTIKVTEARPKEDKPRGGGGYGGGGGRNFNNGNSYNKNRY